MHPLPQTGVLTFVFTDIEGSTTRWDRAPDAMAQALATHDAIVSETLQAHGGNVFKRLGDGFCCVFPVPARAAEAAVEVQRKLASQAWDRAVGELRIRIGVHTGNALSADDDYFGPALNRAARVMACGYGGQILLSSATAALVNGELPPGVDCISLGTHRLPDLAEPETIFQLCAPELQRDFPPPRTLDFHPNNLPIQLSSFVGRDRELQELRALIAQKRLVTLCGPGGIGKTRLAIQSGAELLDEFEDGVWLVRLAQVSDPALAAQTIAVALGVGEAAGEPIETTLLRELAGKQLLIVLDNTEHLMPAIGSVAKTILDNAKDVRVVATSRESLHVRGEQIYRLGPVSDAAAARLFIERAQSAVHDFDPASDLEDLAAVAKAVQGIPLAIELSAARLSTLSLHEIRARLGSQLAFLRSSNVDDVRHNTLRETIAWSYELLSARERALLGVLSIFVGGFTLQACEAIASAAGEPEALDVLEMLVDKSFLSVISGAPESRYRILDVIREYACERSDVELRDRSRLVHFEIFSGLAGRGAGTLAHDDLASWLAAVDSDVANVRAALEFGFENDHLQLGQMLLGLFRYWYIRRTIKEGRAWLKRFLDAHAGDAAPPDILRHAATFASIQGAYDEADELAKRALRRFHQNDDEAGVLGALHTLAVNESRRGNAAGAERLYCDIAARCKQSGQERAFVASSANCAAIKLQHGELDAAAQLLAECVTAAKVLGDPDVSATVTALQGTLAFKRDEFDRAADLFDQALTIKRDLKNEFGEADILAALAVNSVYRERAAEAGEFAAESLDTAIKVDAPNLVVSSLESCAVVLLRRQEPEIAKDAFTLASSIRQMYSLNEKTSLGYDEAESKLRARFGAAIDEPAELTTNWKAAAQALVLRCSRRSEATLT
ncbi:MAG TPA: adenylate/guanylate cyclase domain-containing protein [Candidatus Rubrimentiphilum sp.]|nr:adenylate/guanylate cyclase domain-containing protein [Candidatus Rubrimentiphilum sp.]